MLCEGCFSHRDSAVLASMALNPQLWQGGVGVVPPRAMAPEAPGSLITEMMSIRGHREHHR